MTSTNRQISPIRPIKPAPTGTACTECLQGVGGGASFPCPRAGQQPQEKSCPASSSSHTNSKRRATAAHTDPESQHTTRSAQRKSRVGAAWRLSQPFAGTEGSEVPTPAASVLQSELKVSPVPWGGLGTRVGGGKEEEEARPYAAGVTGV